MLCLGLGYVSAIMNYLGIYMMCVKNNPTISEAGNILLWLSTSLVMYPVAYGSVPEYFMGLVAPTLIAIPLSISFEEDDTKDAMQVLTHAFEFVTHFARMTVGPGALTMIVALLVQVYNSLAS